MNLTDVARPLWRQHLKRAARAVTYQQGSAAPATINAFVRGVRSDDLFAAAMQQDVAAVIDAADFAAAFPARPIPARYDRLRIGPSSYSVEEWRGAPNDGAPVFFKLLLRGGQQ